MPVLVKLNLLYIIFSTVLLHVHFKSLFVYLFFIQVSDFYIGNQARCKEYCPSWFWPIAGKLSWCCSCGSLHASSNNPVS